MPRWRRPDYRLLAVVLAAGVSIAGGTLPAESPRADARKMSRASGVETIGMTVDDMDRSLAFYTTVLPFRKISDEQIDGGAHTRLTGVPGRRRIVRLRLGDELLELTDYLTPGGREIPSDSRSQDLWFQHVAIIVRNMDQAYRRLQAHRVDPVSAAPQRLPDWNRNAGGIEAFYFRDPDRHVLEILSFPAGKGADKWHRKEGALFLGIDHTAIVVSDTVRSLAFYRDLLGLGIAGESENYGIEQARLNDVPGAHLRITALRAPAGPGVEFLEYLAPTDGRLAPRDAQPRDLAHWETTLAARMLDDLERRLRTAEVLFISPAMVRLPDGPAVLVRDPDGHAVKLVEKTS